MSASSNALTTFSPAEVVRLLDRRPDGAQAAVMIQTLIAMPGMQVLDVEMREDEGVVAIETRYFMSGDDENGQWTADVPITLTVPLGPLTRKEMSYNVPLLFKHDHLKDTYAMQVVAAEGFVSPLTLVVEGHDDAD
jgi:hypothetical protein